MRRARFQLRPSRVRRAAASGAVLVGTILFLGPVPADEAHSAQPGRPALVRRAPAVPATDPAAADTARAPHLLQRATPGVRSPES